MPRSRSSLTVSISCFTSCSPREEVGSSMMMSLAFWVMALAISTICCWPMPSLPHSMRVSISECPREDKAFLASSCMR